ncbi:MAG: hypothetical protein WKF97_11340 [Chitinophagaceae bacterium]
MNKTALIFGAGKTGRGFAAHLAFLGGYDIVLIDKSRRLIYDLKKANQYDIQILDNEKMSCTINLSGVYHIEDVLWHDDFVATSLVFTSVFGNNLEELAKYLALALNNRHTKNPEQFLTIITCENLTGAAGFLKKMVKKNLGEEKEKWLSDYVGFSESIIFRTCIEASANQSPLTVRAQNFFELPCDGDAIKEHLHVYGLKPLNNFGNQLRRKIYTYNCINAVITYLGAKKGYSQLYEAGNDAEILETAKKAANETSLAQIAEFDFDRKEQEEWINAAFAKFADKNIPDPIERNGADPARKLGRDDRLIGPALLALKHGIYPEGLLEGIIACFDYNDPNKNFKIADLIVEKGPEFVLKEICGLSMEEELFMLIKEQIIKSNVNGKK